MYVSWARNNRSALVRVPIAKSKAQSTRIEYRAPDPACNPYLAFSVMLAAGLKGIEEGYELPPEAAANIFELTDEERAAEGFGPLPQSLSEALTRWSSPSSSPRRSASTSSSGSCATSARSGAGTRLRSRRSSSTATCARSD